MAAGRMRPIASLWPSGRRTTAFKADRCMRDVVHRRIARDVAIYRACPACRTWNHSAEDRGDVRHKGR
jgi:hypothetical protein